LRSGLTTPQETVFVTIGLGALLFYLVDRPSTLQVDILTIRHFINLAETMPLRVEEVIRYEGWHTYY
jgi:hypothetical protein